ncbi:MAG: hypothetical protein VB087_09760 [Candidatus Limiplasma sp.]|nr:hypothetical protein [Candidatus Limiplasma sp.]
MKIKAVARLASEAKALTLLKDGSRQHIAVASAIYPLDGLPPVDEETILAVLDVPVGDRVDYQILTGPAAPFHDMLEDNLDYDLPAQLTDMLVSVSGETLRPLYSPLGLLCIREAERKPISDSAKTAAYFVRTVGSAPVVIVKNGFQCIACIRPCTAWAQDNACEWLRDLARHAARLNHQLHLLDEQDKRYGSAILEENAHEPIDD